MFFMAINTEEDRLFVEELYFKYRNLIFRMAAKVFWDEMMAEDVVTETMIKVMDNLHNVDKNDEKRQRNYIAIICKNTINDILRKNKHAPTSIEDDYVINVPAEFANPQDILINDEAVGIIKGIINELDETYQVPLMLKRVHNMSVEQISKTLDISIDAVNKRITRAKNKVMSTLAEKGVVKK